jgi:soluble lytic murein transglycosylase
MRPRLGRVIATSIIAVSLFAGPAAAQGPADAAAVKKALAHLKDGDYKEATALAAKMQDPAARDLVTWLSIRLTPRDIGYDRTVAFIRQNPHWPGMSLLRRRAERLLIDEKREPKTVFAFFGDNEPVSGEGMVALARALLTTNDRQHAAPWIRRAWREEEMTETFERDIVATNGSLLTAADHRARADKFFYDGKYEAADRAAERAGKDYLQLSKARNAALRRAGNAGALLNDVPASLRRDPSYLFARAFSLRRADNVKGAAEIYVSMPRGPAMAGPDEWWKERRIVVRSLLDAKEYQLAYRVAALAAEPTSPILKADQHFTAGWVALRYVKDAATAKRHFAMPVHTPQPFYVSRALYWQGRAAEALGDQIGARSAYELAARHYLAFYGQLARAKLNRDDLPFRPMPQITAAERAAFNKNEAVRALQLLYAADADEYVIPIHTDILDKTPTVATAGLLAEIARANGDTRAMVIVGKAGLDRNLAVDAVAFPLTGIPEYKHVGPQVERAMVFAISRQESEFAPYVVSPAKAYGLMQVIRPTGAAIAKRNGFAFDFNKLQRDPVYNVTLGAAELGHLVQNFNGSYVLAFIGYNAGPGRSRQWMNARGDPRGAPTEAVVDWIERVPFTETRLYILRVLENLQVYRSLLTNKRTILLETDLSRGNGSG